MDSVEYSRGWLRAFFDGEGHASRHTWSLTFANTEQSVTDDCVYHLRQFGITPRLYTTARKPPRKAITHTKVNRATDVTRFIREIGSSIPYKRKTMASMLRWFRRPNQRRRNRWGGPPIPTRDEIKALRDKGMKLHEVATHLGINKHTLYHYARNAGLGIPRKKDYIPTREDLRRAYYDELKSLAEVGKQFGYTKHGIWRCLKRYGIPCRRVGRHNKS